MGMGAVSPRELEPGNSDMEKYIACNLLKHVKLLFIFVNDFRGKKCVAICCQIPTVR